MLQWLNHFLQYLENNEISHYSAKVFRQVNKLMRTIIFTPKLSIEIIQYLQSHRIILNFGINKAATVSYQVIHRFEKTFLSIASSRASIRSACLSHD